MDRMQADVSELECCALCAGHVVEALDAAGVASAGNDGCECGDYCRCSRCQAGDAGAQPASRSRMPSGWWARAML